MRERNALAAALKATHASLAKSVRALPKPSPAVWALNQLSHHRKDELRAYLHAADELRRAQTGKGAADVGAVVRAERAARSELVKITTEVLAGATLKVTPALRRRLADTLLAAATGAGRKDLERGRLTAELDPAGLPDVRDVPSLRLVKPSKNEQPPTPRRTGHLRIVAPDKKPERNREREKEAARKAARLERASAVAARRAAAARKKADAAHAKRVKTAEAALRRAETALAAAMALVERHRAALARLTSRS